MKKPSNRVWYVILIVGSLVLGRFMLPSLREQKIAALRPTNLSATMVRSILAERMRACAGGFSQMCLPVIDNIQNYAEIRDHHPDFYRLVTTNPRDANTGLLGRPRTHLEIDPRFRALVFSGDPNDDWSRIGTGSIDTVNAAELLPIMTITHVRVIAIERAQANDNLARVTWSGTFAFLPIYHQLFMHEPAGYKSTIDAARFHDKKHVGPIVTSFVRESGAWAYHPGEEKSVDFSAPILSFGSRVLALVGIVVVAAVLGVFLLGRHIIIPYVTLYLVTRALRKRQGP